MSIFTVKDATTGKTTSTNGTRSLYDGAVVREVNLASSGSSDNEQVTASGTSDVAILTGAGNDTINTVGVVGMSFIDAGQGSNTITLGTGPAAITMRETGTAVANSQPFTLDTISGFQAGDSLTFVGVSTAMFITTRGSTSCYAAWNPSVPGSALDVNFIGAPAGLIATQTATGVTMHC